MSTAPEANGRKRPWSLLSHHGIVLVCLARNNRATIREVSDAAGITERQVARIVKDLADGGLISFARQGSRNVYALNYEAALRHPAVSTVSLGRIIEVLAPVVSPPQASSGNIAAG